LIAALKLALFRAGGAAILLVAVAGCYRGSARTVSLAEIDRQPGWLMVRGVRVIRQESAHDCGSAALAMVLDHWGVSDAAAQILPESSGYSCAEIQRVLLVLPNVPDTWHLKRDANGSVGAGQVCRTYPTSALPLEIRCHRGKQQFSVVRIDGKARALDQM